MKNGRSLRLLAEQLLNSALEATDAARLVAEAVSLQGTTLPLRARRPERSPFEEAVPLTDVHRLWVTGAGKVAGWMGQALEQILGARIATGAICIPPGPAPSLRTIALFRGEHPLPTESGERGTQAILEIWKGADECDLILNVLSGGGSSLLARPAPPLTWTDLRLTIEQILRSGADISELNVVRKHLTLLSGGQLVAHTRARVRSLVLSDVIGDPVDLIASGPTAPDPSTFADAWEVMERRQLLNTVPRRARQRLEEGTRGLIPETPKPGDPIFDRVRNVVVGSNRDALEAITTAGTLAGLRVMRLPRPTLGEAREAGAAFARRLRETEGPCCLLAGGETTVRVSGGGRGGRNQEFVLGAASTLVGGGDCLILSAGTDGIDGNTDAAGAVVDSTTLERARLAGLDPERSLRDNDSFTFFTALGDLVRTGPTHTNVMDVQIGLRDG